MKIIIPGSDSRLVVPGAKEDSVYRGHAAQEARELVSALQNGSSGVCLVSKPDSATGFRAMTLEWRHRDGMAVSPERFVSQAPHPELLAALSKMEVKRRTAIIPEVYSASAGRNVRFAVLLPPKFDPSKKTEVVALVPPPPPSATLAGELVDRDLRKRISEMRMPDVMFVLLERLEHRVGARSAHELDTLAQGVIDDAVMPWVSQALGAAEAPALTLRAQDMEEFKIAPKTLAVRDDGEVGSNIIITDSAGGSARAEPREERSSGGGFFSGWGTPGWVKKANKAGTVLVADGRADPDPVDRDELKRVLRKEGARLPPIAADLRHLKSLERPAWIIPQLRSGAAVIPYGVLVPPGFDIQRREKYGLELVTPPEGKSFAEVLTELSKEPPAHNDRLVLLVDAPRRVVEREILEHLAEFNLDLNRFSTLALSGGPATWKRDLAKGGAPARIAGPVVSVDGKFQVQPPTSNYKLAFPEVSRFGGTERIPEELQKQSAAQGTFFAPVIESKALGKRTRMGIFLPPGYDPKSGEKYPVVVMLPGRGLPLNVWTSAGDLTDKANRLMQGSAQKMILVVAENTDSFWYDYDKNGKGDFKRHDKRDYEGHVMELLDYATKELKGDTERVSLLGISRGGFGAAQLAARHPGKFKAVSCHSALLAFEHKGVLAKNAEAQVREGHFGPSGDAVWSRFNPKDLVEAGAFGDRKTRILLDCAKDDELALVHSLSMAETLDRKGVPFELRIPSKKEGKLTHNWDTWGPLLESWLAFHQATFGEAGRPRVPMGWEDIAKQELKAYQTDLQARREDVQKVLDAVRTLAQQLPVTVQGMTADLPELRPYEPAQRALDRVNAGIEALPELLKRATKALDLDQVPLHVAEDASGEYRAVIRELFETVSRLPGYLESRRIGEPMPRVRAAPGALAKLPAPERKSLEKVMAAVAGAEPVLARLVTARPELFGAPDEVTGHHFSKDLVDFLPLLEPADKKGFLEFLDRIAHKRFDWRRGGYSHSVNSATSVVFNHPGLVLRMIAAARKDEAMEFGGVYSGDGPRRLKPMKDFEAGFRPVPQEGWGEWALPPAELGYERGFLRAIVDELAPSPKSFPPDRFAKNADPVAVSISKITGKEVHYGYAFNLKSGDDLAKAVESQGRYGLAMADVDIVYKGQSVWLHYPVFRDYDPATRTIVMAEWNMPEQRLKVDDLRFETKENRKPAIFYRDSPGLVPFLTPQFQSNWDRIRPRDWKGGDGEGKKKG